MKKWEKPEILFLKNQIVDSLKCVDISDMKLPMIVVYKNALDFPNKYIARIFECEQPTDVIIIRESLQECRDDITAAGFLVCMERNEEDVPSIVETWVK